MYKKNDGVWIPVDAFKLGLNANQTLMLYKIYMLDGDKGCFATNNYFADFFKISTRQVSSTISSLVKKGFIKQSYEYKDGTKSIKYRILRPYRRSLQHPHEEVVSTPTKNSSTINKEVNKDINKKHLSVFDEWYSLYNKKTTKKGAIIQWLKIDPEIYPVIISHTKRFVVAKPDKIYRPDPVRYLKNEVYNDEIIEKEKSKEEIELINIERNDRARKKRDAQFRADSIKASEECEDFIPDLNAMREDLKKKVA
tara:strand:- start:570 stop:1328 length:759 start_codon:yes stop_codon:yes gene_type:complete